MTHSPRHKLTTPILAEDCRAGGIIKEDGMATDSVNIKVTVKEKQNFEIVQCENGFILYPPRSDYESRRAVYCFNTADDLARFIRKYYSKK